MLVACKACARKSRWTDMRNTGCLHFARNVCASIRPTVVYVGILPSWCNVSMYIYLSVQHIYIFSEAAVCHCLRTASCWHSSGLVARQATSLSLLHREGFRFVIFYGLMLEQVVKSDGWYCEFRYRDFHVCDSTYRVSSHIKITI